MNGDVLILCTYIFTCIYKNETGDEPRRQDTQANKGSPLLSEDVPYRITWLRLNQGSLERRREKVIWELALGKWQPSPLHRRLEQ